MSPHLSLWLLPFSSAVERLHSLPESAVRSDQVPALPGKEVPRVMNDFARMPFECVPGPGLVFDMGG
jgi:hypothetical protein